MTLGMAEGRCCPLVPISAGRSVDPEIPPHAKTGDTKKQTEPFCNEFYFHLESKFLEGRRCTKSHPLNCKCCVKTKATNRNSVLFSKATCHTGCQHFCFGTAVRVMNFIGFHQCVLTRLAARRSPRPAPGGGRVACGASGLGRPGASRLPPGPLEVAHKHRSDGNRRSVTLFPPT